MSILKRVGIMWDIESLDLVPKAVATQLAFIAYDLDDPETILREVEEYLPIQPQLTLNRTISASTLLWWMKQDDASRSRMQQSDGDDFDELSALVQSVNRKLAQVIAEADEYEIWARGPQFDLVVVESLLGDLGQKAPWKYDKVMDLRTTMRLAGIRSADVPMRPGLVAHHALSDCRYQIDCYVESMRRIRAKV